MDIVAANGLEGYQPDRHRQRKVGIAARFGRQRALKCRRLKLVRRHMWEADRDLALDLVRDHYAQASPPADEPLWLGKPGAEPSNH